VELGLVCIVLAGIVYTVGFLLIDGYLPPPYFYGGQSVLTDWTVTAYFSNNNGAYTAFGSVYPPLSFVFLRLFSVHECYRHYDDIFAARECDWLAPATILVFFVINIPVAYRAFHVLDPRTAWMRTIAVCLGLPSVYALERGNLIIPCLTFFMIGNSRAFRSSPLKWLGQAVAANFKPYLVLALAGPFMRGRWRFVEGSVIVLVLLYAVTFALEGAGDPIQVVQNIVSFSVQSTRGVFERSVYASSYRPLIDLLASDFPLMHFTGSTLIEGLSFALPLSIQITQLAIFSAFGLAFLYPGVIPASRLSALAVGWSLVTQDPGGYATVFLVFLVFLEPWRNPFISAALVTSYVLCVSLDLEFLNVAHQTIISYLTNREVNFALGANVGELLRPGLIIVINIVLVAASVLDVVRSTRRVDASTPLPDAGVAAVV
jgi:hypothetical protein